jgi:broad specificity phosphatase PhoE
VFTSDLKRAKETFELCFAFENVNKEESPMLREIYFGKNEGLFYDGK